MDNLPTAIIGRSWIFDVGDVACYMRRISRAQRYNYRFAAAQTFTELCLRLILTVEYMPRSGGICGEWPFVRLSAARRC